MSCAFRCAPPLNMHTARHGRAWPGHPRLHRRKRNPWMPGSSPGMTELYRLLIDASTALDTYLGHEEFDAAMRRLAALRGPVDEFFDKVTVNVEDKGLRENRLRLLSRIRAVMNQVADFSQIEG